MKTRILFCAVAFTLLFSERAIGQTDNVYPVLKTRDGNVYTNARIHLDGINPAGPGVFRVFKFSLSSRIVAAMGVQSAHVNRSANST
jgi:hypothetical protein